MSAFKEATQIGHQSQKNGFDWPSYKEVLNKVREELQELEEAPNSQNQEEELGDLLFSVIQLSRHLNLDPESTLEKANKKFLARYDKMIKLCIKQERDFSQLSLEEKEHLWHQVKKSLP